MRSQCRWIFACSSHASCVASFFVTHSQRGTAQVGVALPNFQSLPSSMKYPLVWCAARLHSLSVDKPVIPSSVLTTSRNTCLFSKHSRSSLCRVEVATSTKNRSYSRLQAGSQSGGTDHVLLSPSSCGRSSSLRLNPSPTTLMCPSICQTSTIWWAMMPSRCDVQKWFAPGFSDPNKCR